LNNPTALIEIYITFKVVAVEPYYLQESNGKKYTLKGPIRPSKNKFRNNTIVADDVHIDSTLLEFSATVEEVADNVFEDNKLFGENAKRGDILQEAINTLTAKPVIEMSDVKPAM
jgi:hypothetical protein